MKGKAIGKIIEWVNDDNQHYPVFLFTTENGIEIKGRCITYENGEKLETSLESQYDFEMIDKILEAPLPHDDIYIDYDKDNPNNFLAKWIMPSPEDFLIPTKESQKEETVFKFLKNYILFIVVNLLFPFIGLIPVFIEAKSYSHKYQAQKNKIDLIKSVLYWLLFVFGLVYAIYIIIDYLMSIYSQLNV